MNIIIRKYAPVVSFIFMCLLLYSTVKAGPVDPQKAQNAAETFLKVRNARTNKGFSPLSVNAEKTPKSTGFKELRGNDGTVIAYIADLEPRGFIATSADTNITPIIAYSFSTPFPDYDEKNPLYRMLKADMELRARALTDDEYSNTAENQNLWNLYADNEAPDAANETFQQWPEENTTSTGGWLETTWDQAEPYNEFCPLDPVDANRTYVGCVATAMAQLVHYHKTFGIQFDEDDSYTTFYGIDFDDDSELYDFPSFKELNKLIAHVHAKHEDNIDMNDTDIAVMSFACGIAIEMDYSSEGSGASPYAVRESLLDKFGYYSADMTGGLSRDTYQILQENIINRLPTILSISPPDGWGGHVVVCDGYNTNNEYHLNFGWGPEHPNDITEVWYNLPGNLMTGLSIVTEAILNIQPDMPDIDIQPTSLSFNAIPGQESERQTLHIESFVDGAWINSISCSEGFVCAKWGDTFSNYMEAFQLPEKGTLTSIYVKFVPDEARGYYGTLEINYSDGNKKHVILKGYSFNGGTEIPAGDISGTWTQAESPYFISGDISIARNRELSIEPGVEVIFAGQYGMTIGENALLKAEGTENSPIEFTTLNTETGWAGLRFMYSGSDDILNHCSISFSKKNEGFIADNGLPEEDICGGAVYCYLSDPTITNCKLTNNIGDRGGAIYCDESYPTISNTVIANNSSLGGSPQAGGICIGEWGKPEILNCTIVNNLPGGIFTQSEEGIEITNSIIWGNERYQIRETKSIAIVSFCDIQEGYDGLGNIDADPSFLEPSLGAGYQFDGSAANWMLKSSSPCINSGRRLRFADTDLADNPRICNDIIDIGAYENQSELPLITIAPSASGDAGFTRIDNESRIYFDIVNTGTMDFDVESLSIPDVNTVFSILTPIENQTLTAGDSVMVEIGFIPTEEKIYTDTLEIHSTCSNAPIKTISLHGVGVTGTIITEGKVDGTWTKSESPYSITGDIEITKGRKLTIEPGVVIKFAGHYKFTVGYRATLLALGTEEENIVFTATDTEEGWYGMRFINTDDDDRMEYCTLEYSIKPRSKGNSFENFMGGAILCTFSEEAEPHFPIPSSPTIDHCIISKSHAEYGGGIMLFVSDAVITNNRIVDNSAIIGGGGIYSFAGGCTITNNIIAHNHGGIIGGGIWNMLEYASIINNTIIHNRPNGLHLSVTELDTWDPGYGRPILNNIIWYNELFIEDDVAEDEYDIRFNNIQGGWKAEGNIEVDPLFADPENRDYHLKSQAGRWEPLNKSWVIDKETSPCIDTGDWDTYVGDEPVTNGGRINMGAYGGTSEASKS